MMRLAATSDLIPAAVRSYIRRAKRPDAPRPSDSPFRRPRGKLIPEDRILGFLN